MKCFNCGRGIMTRQAVPIEGEIKNEKFTVTSNALVCAKCNHVGFEGKDVQEHMRRLADAYRGKYSLLTSNQIRESRKSLKMSQKQFAGYLRVGDASIKRWELGGIQDESHDLLIRLMTDPTDASRNAKQLAAKRAAVNGDKKVFEGSFKQIDRFL